MEVADYLDLIRVDGGAEGEPFSELVDIVSSVLVNESVRVH